jgi:hypothetical protein
LVRSVYEFGESKSADRQYHDAAKALAAPIVIRPKNLSFNLSRAGVAFDEGIAAERALTVDGEPRAR